MRLRFLLKENLACRVKRNRHPLKQLMHSTTWRREGMNTASCTQGGLHHGIGCAFFWSIIRLGAGKGAIDHVLKHGYKRINLRRTLNISKALLPAVGDKQFRSRGPLRTLPEGVTQPDEDGKVIAVSYTHLTLPTSD